MMQRCLSGSDGGIFLKFQPNVDSERIYVFGHSEGTQVAIDYAIEYADVAGLILVGFSGEDIKTVLEWQLADRIIDHFITTDVDSDHDGFVTETEAEKWFIYFRWDFSQSDRVSIETIREYMRRSPELEHYLEKLRSSPLYSDGVFNRGSIYRKAASLRTPLYVFTGELDMQTPTKEALKLGKTCLEMRKSDCRITLVFGVGHAFSPPKAPRAHPLLDMTLGPVSPAFSEILQGLATELSRQ
jgi:pimeloyl-ACP methyl ester carboxylesterase